jgi:hypothetical protein
LHCSRRVGRPHAARNLPTAFALDDGNVVLTLQVEPKLRAVAKIAPEPHRRISRDRSAAIQDVSDATGRDAEVEGKAVGAKVARRHLSLQEPARMGAATIDHLTPRSMEIAAA